MESITINYNETPLVDFLKCHNLHIEINQTGKNFFVAKFVEDVKIKYYSFEKLWLREKKVETKTVVKSRGYKVSEAIANMINEISGRNIYVFGFVKSHGAIKLLNKIKVPILVYTEDQDFSTQGTP